MLQIRGLIEGRHPLRTDVGIGSRVLVVVFIAITNFEIQSLVTMSKLENADLGILTG